MTDRFLGGVGFSAAAAPVTLDLKVDGVGEAVTRVTDTIPAFTETMQPLTTTVPEQTANFGRFITAQITEVTAFTPTITRTPDVVG